jgi:leucyl aminopeptidase
MKEIINVEVKARKADFTKRRTDLLAVGMFSDTKALKGAVAGLNRKLGGVIERSIKLGDFKGKVGEVRIIYGNKRIAAKRVLLVGLGEEKKATVDTVRKAAVCAADKAVSLKAKTAVLALHDRLGGSIDVESLGQAIAEGACYGSYRYDEFVTGGEDGRLTAIKAEVVDTDTGRSRRLAKGVAVGNIIGQAQSFARTIANRPGNVVDPAALAEIAGEMVRGADGLTCTVFDEKQLEKKKMGGILAVGSGSKSKPRLIILKYAPAGGRAKMPVVGLVGKDEA